MILKDADNRSEDIAELKRLRDVSPRRFRAVIQKQINNLYCGLNGENSAAHFISREFGKSENTAILNDLRIGMDDDYAQIDHLVIHRVQAVAWVLETKNYSGRLTCDEHGDWTVWTGSRPVSIASPINQARRQCAMLRQWLDAYGLDKIREIRPVVLISPTSSVDRRKLPADAHVVKSDNFVSWWKEQSAQIGFASAVGLVGRHLLKGMSQDDFEGLGEQLVRAHTPFKRDWRATLRLPHEDKSKKTDPQPDEQVPPADSFSNTPQIIATLHGDITISQIAPDCFALRNEKNDALIEVVRTTCKGHARWNPRYRNWLIQEEQLPEILIALSEFRK
ncbi:nuclease-related domain-containing protein [Altererythrobacter aquiaggeris]|uniref:nuclease-related domain-containing protein n=1 Tax=Aestuarierythrobacter aquiaggeris TaxID=1898396 RepID=UPI003016139F